MVKRDVICRMNKRLGKSVEIEGLADQVRRLPGPFAEECVTLNLRFIASQANVGRTQEADVSYQSAHQLTQRADSSAAGTCCSAL